VLFFLAKFVPFFVIKTAKTKKENSFEKIFNRKVFAIE
jgi:hypothetical protein